MSIPVGDVVLSVDTSEFEDHVNEMISRLERALAAFRAEWNDKKETKTIPFLTQNELRAREGLPPITLDDIRNQAKIDKPEKPENC